MGPRACALWLGLFLASLAQIARAEGRPTLLADHQPNAPKAALELELGYRFYSNDVGSAHFLTPALNFRYAFSQHAELTLDWPMAFAASDPKVGNGDSSFKSGNPNGLLYYVGHFNNGYFRVGGGVALPVARANSSAAAIAYVGALAMNGLYDSWRYLPDTLSLIAPFRIEVRNAVLVLGGEAALGIMIPTRGQNRDTDLELEFAPWLGARIDNVTLGARLQLAWIATQDGDNAQLAVVPFVQGDFSGGGFFYGRLLLNLDEPLGFGAGSTAFDKVWALFLGGGARF